MMPFLPSILMSHSNILIRFLPVLAYAVNSVNGTDDDNLSGLGPDTILGRKWVEKRKILFSIKTEVSV